MTTDLQAITEASKLATLSTKVAQVLEDVQAQQPTPKSVLSWRGAQSFSAAS